VPDELGFLVPLTVWVSLDANGEPAPFVFPFLLLAEYVFCTPPLVCLLSEGGCNSSGMTFVRPDFRFPSCVKDDGPSATIFFQGGDSGFGRGFWTVSLTRRLLAGGPWSSFPLLPLFPFVLTTSVSVSGTPGRSDQLFF
jgi:hypothetical protein